MKNCKSKLDLFLCDRELHKQLAIEMASKSIGNDNSRLLDMISRITGGNESFYQALSRYIDQRGYTEVKFYTDSCIGAATFANIRNPRHRPSKDTVIKCLLTLELDFIDASYLLEKPGYTFVWSDIRDLIILFCIRNEIFQKEIIDDLLIHKSQNALFSTE